MRTKAHIRGERLVLDEPGQLPARAEVESRALDGSEFSPEERARLDASLERSLVQLRAGLLIDGDEVIHKLLARG